MVLVSPDERFASVGPQFVGEPLVLPTFVDGAAKRFVVGVICDAEMEVEVEVSGPAIPGRVFAWRCQFCYALQVRDCL